MPKLRVALIALVVVSSAGCGRATVPVPPAGAAAPLALVLTDDGLAGVPVGSSTPAWVVPGAVAAPDGSAIYAVDERDEIVRIDPHTGAATAIAAVAAGMRVAAVAPDGARVVLVARDGGATDVLDFDPATPRPQTARRFDGVLEPEAYSSDGSRVFAARDYGDRYHVHVLELRTGAQYPTAGPDKTSPPEDMFGSVVQAVLSPDRRHLATLYRDDSTPDHTAFIHLLSLENGSTICIDLHAPFGTTAVEDDALEWRGGVVAVGHVDETSSTVATFDTAALASAGPVPHHHADARPDPDPPSLPAGLADTPGFQRFIAVVP